MKRFSFKFLAVIVAMLVMISTTAFAAEATTYVAGEDFYTTPGGSDVWVYQYDDGTGFKDYTKLFTDWGDNYWVMAEDPNAGPYANINLDPEDNSLMVLHPDKFADTGAPINVAVAFKAPAAGTVVIPETTATHIGYNDPDDDKGTKVWIELNGTTYSETAIGYESSAAVAGQTLTVKAGDLVRFVANNNGRGGNNVTKWNINLTFTPAEAAATTDTPTAGTTTDTTAANPATGDNGFVLYGFLAAAALLTMVLIPRKRLN